MGRKKSAYAAYQGDTFLGLGTIQEIAELLGITLKSAQYYTSPTHHKRKGENGTIVFKIEDDEEDEVI